MRFLEGTICATAGLAILALAPSANAQTFGTHITPGSTVPLTAGSDLATTVPGAGSTLIAANTGGTYDSGNQGGNRLMGTYISEVYQETGGNLDFYYQFTVDSGATGPAFSFGTSNFAPTSANVGYTTSAIGSTSASTYSTGGPNSASESNGTSDTISFDFTGRPGGGVAAGARSVTLLISTTSTTYTTNNASLQGGATANFTVFSPFNSAGGTGTGAAAPEPGALALVVPGVLGLVGMARRRKTA